VAPPDGTGEPFDTVGAVAGVVAAEGDAAEGVAIEGEGAGTPSDAAGPAVAAVWEPAANA